MMHMRGSSYRFAQREEDLHADDGLAEALLEEAQDGGGRQQRQQDEPRPVRMWKHARKVRTVPAGMSPTQLQVTVRSDRSLFSEVVGEERGEHDEPHVGEEPCTQAAQARARPACPTRSGEIKRCLRVWRA